MTGARIPVSTIGGYLGAGKTTLVNHLLRHNEGRRLAVLVNEFGALPIDADLIEGAEDGVIALSGGCVCCSYGSDLLAALEDVQAFGPDHILVEASGVALPGSIATMVRMVAGLRADAVLVLADAEQVRDHAANTYMADTITRQLAQADILLVTKTDLVSAPALQAVTDWLQTHALRAKVVPVVQGAVPLGAVLDALPVEATLASPLAQTTPAGSVTHDRFSSVVLRPDGPVDVDRLAQVLARAPEVVRAKGVLPAPEGMVLLQVAGRRADIGPAPEVRETGVVCIGAADVLDPAPLEAMLAACQMA